MKFLILTLMQSEQVWLQAVLIKHAEFITSQHSHAPEFSKAMRVKSLRSFSTLRVTKSSQQVLTKWPDFGIYKQVNVFKFFKAMKIKYFHVCSTMKVILLSQVLKITHVRFGGILKFMERKRNDFIEKKLKINLKKKIRDDFFV